jgi:hypothetical protein
MEVTGMAKNGTNGNQEDHDDDLEYSNISLDSAGFDEVVGHIQDVLVGNMSYIFFVLFTICTVTLNVYNIGSVQLHSSVCQQYRHSISHI